MESELPGQRKSDEAKQTKSRLYALFQLITVNHDAPAFNKKMTMVIAELRDLSNNALMSVEEQKYPERIAFSRNKAKLVVIRVQSKSLWVIRAISVQNNG